MYGDDPTDSTGATTDGEASADDTATDRPDGSALEVTVSGPGGERTVFDGTDVADVGEVQRGRGGGVQLPVELTDDGTAAAREAFLAVGGDDAPGETTATIAFDVEETGSFEVRPDLARAIAAGEWSGEFVLTFANESSAEAARETIVGD